MSNMDNLQEIMEDISRLRDKLANIPDYIMGKDQYRKIDNKMQSSYDNIKVLYDCLIVSKEQYLLDNPIKAFRFNNK